MFDKESHPFCFKGYQYALDVREGKITSCVFIKGAVERFFKDIERAKHFENPFYFCPDRAERFLRLVQKFKHVKGHWENPYIILEPWQCFGFMNMYGFISRKTGSRRFRTSHWELARGNGKSANASQVGLYHLSLESPVGNEVYSAATKKDQAKIVLDSARLMAKGNKGFLKKTGTRVLAHSINHDSSGSIFKALSSDSDGLDGLQPACAVIDELHAHKTRLVYDAIDSAMSKRRDSLLFVITTAGFDTSGIGHSQSVYAKKVATGEVEDDSFFAFVFTLDEGDDIYDPANWPKANPNFGISVDPQNFASKAEKTKVSPEDKRNFLVKHLNLWINSMSPFFSMEKWDAQKRDIKLQDFIGQPCWVAVDLASKCDLVSFSYIFKVNGEYQLFTENFIPKETVEQSDNNSYLKWVHNGELTQMEGAVINFPKLQDILYERSKMFKFKGCHFDPWSANEFAQRMINRGIDMIEFRMSTPNLSEPMKKIDAELRDNKLVHSGNSLERWCFSNVVAKRDANDNVFPRKENEKLKIDPAVASIMAMAGYVADEEKESVYEKRGIMVL